MSKLTGKISRLAGLIINADDWGRDRETTDRTLDCVRSGGVSSVSAMVFMQDSERSAAIAQEHAIDRGLHLNFTTAFTGAGTTSRLREHQERVGRYLSRYRFAQAVYHPGLRNSFEHVVAAQVDGFRRLYGAEPTRFDGHHHMHLCANVLLQRLIPAGTIARRNFHFVTGEKNVANRLYRRFVDSRLSQRHLLADFLFSLPPLEPVCRLRRIISHGRNSLVEIETHPVRQDEHRFLSSGQVFRVCPDVPIVSFSSAMLGRPDTAEHGIATGPAHG